MKFVRLKKWQFTAGFTMAEVMIVVLIMGIVTLVGLPLLTTSMDHCGLKGAAEEAVNALQYGRSVATNSGRKTRVVIGHLSNRIAVRQFTTAANLTSGGNQLIAGNVESGTYELMEYPLKKGIKYPVLFDNENRFRGVDITVSDFHKDQPVTFDTLGGPSHGGTATLTLKAQQMVVTLDALTGKVFVSD